ncbi:phosphoribosylanthranilate isomerase [Solemya velesiana gill symbiont]|uniref:N-(5'-phosphoribosyl)anthranilate isomerase n=1 Tax=Solemya velesiana gill symbiont TaxID=1918948 RepID=A0A1T2KV55_9GAMM|nr:phosphoribosylanthranilate isomerase [Solemya velesiana gill symbiont]OOZ36606.1 N-(5'-phosphoribosyl)anthranilate isomerase [Solemya velesiana gill symbiont]
MRYRAKICGITRPEDALEAVCQGADAIGLVFYPPSPRAISIEQAAQIVKGLPPFVTVVGLFVNATAEEINAVLSGVRLDLLQFHGDETHEACIRYGKPFIKAIRMREGVDLYKEQKAYPDAAGLLLDTYQKGVPGGTGERFNWELIPADLAGGIVLAGGLSPENVEQAINSVHPYAVDVSGGVELNKGIKDSEKVAAFMRGVKRANQ